MGSSWRFGSYLDRHKLHWESQNVFIQDPCHNLCFSFQILVKCQEVNRIRDEEDAITGSTSSFGPGRLLQSYEDIGEAAYGKLGRQFITAVRHPSLCAMVSHMQFCFLGSLR